MSLDRTRIATGATLAALGVLAALALSAGGDEPSTTAAPAAAPTPEVRTEIIRRTVHVKSKSGSSASAGASRPTASPAQAAAPAGAPAPRAAAPVRSDDSGHRGDDDHSDDDGSHGDDEDDDDGHGRGGDDDGGDGGEHD